MTRTARTFPVLLAAACLIAVPCVAMAQSGPPIPMQSAPQPAPARLDAPQPALAWSQLSAVQQRMLAPVQAQWARLKPQRQHSFATHATRWATLPDKQQQLIRQRLTRWAEMTPAQRRQLRQNARAFRKLSPAERARVSVAFRTFQSLSPAERRALRERWDAMPPQQRARWSNVHPIPLQPPPGSR